MTTYRAPLFLVLGSLAIFGCWQKLDANASSGLTNVAVDPNGGIGAPFAVMTATPDIGEVAGPGGDPTQTTTNPCDKLALDAQTVLTTFCSTCHEVGANGNFQGVQDATSLINKPASSKYPGWKFIVPGDPTNSLIFHRLVVLGDMPPPSTVDSPVPHPTISDMSVLRDWILCLGPAPDGGTATAAAPDGGAK